METVSLGEGYNTIEYKTIGMGTGWTIGRELDTVGSETCSSHEQLQNMLRIFFFFFFADSAFGLAESRLVQSTEYCTCEQMRGLSSALYVR